MTVQTIADPVAGPAAALRIMTQVSWSSEHAAGALVKLSEYDGSIQRFDRETGLFHVRMLQVIGCAMCACFR